MIFIWKWCLFTISHNLRDKLCVHLLIVCSFQHTCISPRISSDLPLIVLILSEVDTNRKHSAQGASSNTCFSWTSLSINTPISLIDNLISIRISTDSFFFILSLGCGLTFIQCLLFCGGLLFTVNRVFLFWLKMLSVSMSSNWSILGNRWLCYTWKLAVSISLISYHSQYLLFAKLPNISGHWNQVIVHISLLKRFYKLGHIAVCFIVVFVLMYLHLLHGKYY